MKEVVLAKLGARIRQRREALGYTQESFAHYAQVARTFYGRIERGEQNVNYLTLCHIAAHLGSPVSDLTQDATVEVCCTAPISDKPDR